MLHCCVAGSNLHTQQSHYLLTLSDLSSDYDLMLGQVKSFEPPPSQATTTDFGNLLTVAEGKGRKMSFSKSIWICFEKDRTAQKGDLVLIVV